MKKFFSILLTLTLLMGMVTGMAVESSAAVADGLIAHWDFEGDDTTALNDKATNGANADNLKKFTGDGITVANGVLSLAAGTDNFVYAEDSADLLRTAETRTVFMRFRLSTVAEMSALMCQNSAFRSWHAVGSQEIGTSTSPDAMGANGNWCKQEGFTIKADTWYNYAISYVKNGDNVKITSYLSENGSTPIMATSEYTIAADYWTKDSSANIANGKAGKDSLYIGRRYDGGGQNVPKTDFDEIRIYNVGLDLGQFNEINANFGPDVTSGGHSLTLASDIGVNFYLKPKTALIDSNAAVTITNGETVLVDNVQAFVAANAASNAAGAYRFTAKVSAKQMTDDLTLTVKRGEEVIYTETYCAKDYTDAFLASPSGTFGNTYQNLVKALVNYAGYLQTHLEYKTDDLANAGLNEALADVTADTETYKGITTGGVAAVTKVETSLQLDGKLAVVFTLTLASGTDASALTVEGGTVTAEGNTVTVVADAVFVQSLDRYQKLTVTKGEETLTVKYSPMAYIMEELDNTDADLVAALKALHAYGAAADAFAEKNMK